MWERAMARSHIPPMHFHIPPMHFHISPMHFHIPLACSHIPLGAFLLFRPYIGHGQLLAQHHTTTGEGAQHG